MWITWRLQLKHNPQFQDFSTWPVIDPLSIPKKHRANFVRNREIASQVLAGQPLNSIANEKGINAANITRLMDRCLGGEEESLPALTLGLIPERRLGPNQRQTELSTVNRTAGAASAFSHLLATVPGLIVYLDKLLTLYAKQSRRGQNLRIKNFHSAFVSYLSEQHWPQDTYPFTTISLAYESVRHYFHERLLALTTSVSPTRVILPSHSIVGIFEEIQCDEHTVDCRGSVVIILNDLWEHLALSRITLIAAREVATGAVLGFVIVLNRSPSQQDLLALLEQLISPWSAPPLTAPGLSLPPGNYMPTQLGEEFCRPVFGVFRFDNALIHRAISVRGFICDTLGATFQLGIPRTPLARALIESAFRDLNLSVHRVPSTTGSHPMDEVREPLCHRKKTPIVSLKALEDMIHVHVADMNQRPMANLGSHTPIGVMKFQMAQHLIPLRPALLKNENPLRGREMVVVHHSSEHTRLPWVNFAYNQYRGDIPTKFYNRLIEIQFNRLDIRQLDAYSVDGELICTLRAPKAYQRFPHSLQTAKYIHKMVKDGRIQAADPLGGYFNYLVEHRHLPTEALELIRISREFGSYAQPAGPAEPESSESTESSGSDADQELQSQPDDRPQWKAPPPDERETPVPKSPVPRWSTSMVDQRKPS